MLDGGHRSLAIIEANVPVPAVVIYGVSNESFITMDAGATRTKDDAFSMLGKPDSRRYPARCERFSTLAVSRGTAA